MHVHHARMPPAPAVDLGTIYRWMRILVSLSAGLDSSQVRMVFARTVRYLVRTAMVQDTTSALAATVMTSPSSHQDNVFLRVLLDLIEKESPTIARHAMLPAHPVLVKEQTIAWLALHPSCYAMGSVSPARLATSSPCPVVSATHATPPVLSALDQIPPSAQAAMETYSWTPGPPSVFPAARRTLHRSLPAVTVLDLRVSAPPQQDS